MKEAPKETENPREARRSSQSLDWYSPGQSRTVEINGVDVIVRLVGRKGPAGQIAIEAPSGGVRFC